jgi:general nucleoside transport system permease protein
MLVTGANLRAAQYAGIAANRRMLLAALLGGGLGGVAGMTELLGAQHRLMDGISGGTGFLGLVVALLAQLNPLAVVPTAIFYGGMTVGADAIERHTQVPSSITLILESLIVLFVLASQLPRRYRLRLPRLGAKTDFNEAEG